jgi:hypothetical protein
MLRKLCSAAVALLFVAGFGVGVSGISASAADGARLRSVIPHHGTYTGADQDGRHVSFSFGGTHGNQMTHFTVGHQVIGGAHVSNGAWHETCHNGLCTKGMWQTNGHVTGAWRHGGSHTWTTFTATSNAVDHPYTGTYMGRDHRNLSIRFSYSGGHLMHFTLDHNVIGSAPVTNRQFSACHGTICFQGRWQTAHQVVGSWRYTNSHEWNAWEAYAFAA